MAQELADQVQGMFKSIYEAADLKYLRPLKRNMFACGIDCLDDKNSVKQAERCIDSCETNMRTAMTIVQKEVNAFQGRIDRCLIDCQDSVRNEKDEAKARLKFDDCAEVCVKKFIPAVPEVVKSLCESLEKLKQNDV
jgi:hypothetical protein